MTGSMTSARKVSPWRESSSFAAMSGVPNGVSTRRSGALDDPLVRQLWVLKAYRDVVVDDRGIKPLDPEEIWRTEKWPTSTGRTSAT